MNLKDGKAIILFRFHSDIDIAKERIKILRYFNPDLPIYGLFGGSEKDYNVANKQLGKLVEHIWLYPRKEKPDWKWIHSDLMTKEWFRDFGYLVDFDFMYSYEYDLLTLAPLSEIYPNIDENTLALAAVAKLKDIEGSWWWTSDNKARPNFLKFKEYMKQKYGQDEQVHVCLGPGPLLPKRFLEKFAETEGVELVHEEITLPAYAEVFGFKLADHGMHPGFGSSAEKQKIFNCHNKEVDKKDIQFQMQKSSGIRAFHPVKYQVTLDEILEKLKP